MRHRPDGYWKIPSGENQTRVLALEVELSLKNKYDYELIGDTYSRFRSIEQVFWLVRDITSAKRIFQNLVGRNTNSENFLKHYDCYSSYF